MDSKAQPLHQVARLAATVLIASVVSLGTGAAASAQTLKPDVPDRSAPTLVPLAPTVPGRPPCSPRKVFLRGRMLFPGSSVTMLQFCDTGLFSRPALRNGPA